MKIKNKNNKKILFIIISILIVFAFISIFVNLFNKRYQIGIVSGNSMLPTLHDNDFLILDKTKDINKYDIVIVKDDNIKKHMIKRVLGLPNDKITIDSGNFYINNKLQKETYLNNDNWGYVNLKTNRIEPFYTSLSDNEYFLLGDNRNYSIDSRKYGNYTKSQISGVVIKNITVDYGITFNECIEVVCFLIMVLLVFLFFILKKCKK